MSRGDKVKIKGTSKEGVIVQVGNRGLLRVDIIKGYNGWDRTVYDENELEVI